MHRAALTIGTKRIDVTRPSREDAWTGNGECPVCGIGIHVRAYHDEEKVSGNICRAPAWCRGRHPEPIGELSIEQDPNTLMFMGEISETFRCRIF